jgi:predicted nucleic acid-binding protein
VAEPTDLPLLTADADLAGAHRPRAVVELV